MLEISSFTSVGVTKLTVNDLSRELDLLRKSIKLRWTDGNLFANLGPTDAKRLLRILAILLGLLEIKLSLSGSLIKLIGLELFDLRARILFCLCVAQIVVGSFRKV